MDTKSWFYGLWFTLVYLSIFLFGMIWLNKGFKVEDQLLSRDKKINFQDEEITSLHLEIKTLQTKIMPSCFKEQSRREHK